MLNDLLQFEVKDPRLKGVRVSETQVSGDLGVARAFYSPLEPDADIGPIEDALAKAAAFMRARAGRELKLRRVPELRFELDASVREGMRISRLIDETHSTGSRSGDDGDPSGYDGRPGDDDPPGDDDQHGEG